MQLFWTPQDEAPPDSGRFAQRSRLVRFVGVSVAVHVLALVAAPWLSSLMPPREEPVVIRTVDFVVPDTPPPPAQTPKPDAPLGDRDERAGSPPIRPAREGGRPAAKPAPVPRKEPVKAPSAVAKAEVPPRESPKAPMAMPPRVVAKADAPAAPAPAARAPSATPPTPPVSTASPAGDLPTPAAPAEDPRLAAATPKTLGSMSARPRGPATVGAPSPAGGSSPSASPPGTATASVPSVMTGVAGTGAAPVAPVALPPGLSGIGGGSGGGVGGGTGGRGGSGGGDGTGHVDMRDPDFSEYFRLIEKRVRSAWKFPESLGGTTQTVKIGFALGPEGSLRDVRVVSSSSGTLNESALTAMKQAAPFPPLPVKFRTLAGQPLIMSFTVTIQ